MAKLITSLKPAEFETFELLQNAEARRLAIEQLAQLQSEREELTGKPGAILVVDDSRELRTITVLTLNALGYPDVSQAGDGLEALAMMKEQSFDLVILDIEMPKLDGYGVLTALKEDGKEHLVPIIVVSGYDQVESVVRCIKLGAEDFMHKPINSVLLAARVGASLDRKRLRDLERLRALEVQREKELLEIEQAKSERLLLNILPAVIADRLKQGERTIAERYASVTVLFADLVDFIALATRTDPVELVSLLNDLFSRFDRIADVHGLEKIKTIGDSYLVVGGLLATRPNHAEAVAEMSLEMLAALQDLNRARGLDLQLRIGIHTGPVVAGVIGRKKFTYDLWGATVNLAHRMQSTGLPNRVHVTAETSDVLRQKFHFTDRGTVDCKGLGKVRTCLLDHKLSVLEQLAPEVSPE